MNRVLMVCLAACLAAVAHADRVAAPKDAMLYRIALPATEQIVHAGKGQTETRRSLSAGQHMPSADFTHTALDPALHSMQIAISVG